MAKKSFIDVADSIFLNKDRYRFVTEEEKIDNFYILNRKFSFMYYYDWKLSKNYDRISMFNHRYIDKASAMDIWNVFFKNTKEIPQFYWKSARKVSKDAEPKKVKKLSDEEFKLIMNYENIDNEEDVVFLFENFKEDVLNVLSKAKKFVNKIQK